MKRTLCVVLTALVLIAAGCFLASTLEHSKAAVQTNQVPVAVSHPVTLTGTAEVTLEK